MGAYNNQDQAIAGLRFGSEARVETFRCAESVGINFGAPVFGYEGDDVNGYAAHDDISTIVWDADFVTGNSIAVTINGTTVTTPFNTDQATTMADLVSDIEGEAALSGIDAERTDIAGNDRTLKLFWKGVDLTVTEVVTGGASQATGTITANQGGIFVGVAVLTHKEFAGSAKYELDEAMNVMAEGYIWVLAAAAVNSQTDAYVVTTGADQNKFSSSGYATGARFRSTVAAAGLVQLEVNGQNTD